MPTMKEESTGLICFFTALDVFSVQISGCTAYIRTDAASDSCISIHK